MYHANHRDPLIVRARAEVERRAWTRHQANLTAWANADEGAIPTLDQAREEELRATEILLRALEHLALHEPGDVFFEDRDWRPWYPD